MKPVKKIVGLRRTFANMNSSIHNTMGVDAYYVGIHQLKDNTSIQRARGIVLESMSPCPLSDYYEET